MKTDTKRIFNKLWQRAAFSLQEMLIAVAVLVILMGISVPLVANLTVQLKMTEMDHQAKTIYLEAQYQLTAMKMEGSLKAYADDLQTNYTARFLEDAPPQDYDTVNNGEEYKELCYLSKADAACSNVIPQVSNTYQMVGDYVVEFHPERGLVYGVFYWDKNNPISYDADVKTLADRSRANRTDLRVGYYGGEIASKAAEDAGLSGDVGLINEEELYVRMLYDLTDELTGLTIECTVEDEHSNIWSTSMPASNFNLTEEGQLEYTVLLDSMEPGYHLADITSRTGNRQKLVTGDNLTVNVAVLDDSGGIVEEHGPFEDNSAFASRSYSDANGMKIELSRLRHFYNLSRMEVVGSYASPLVTIDQREDIDFNTNGFAWTKAGSPGGEKKYVGAGEPEAERPVDAMPPTRNNFLFKNSGTITEAGDRDANASNNITLVNGRGYKFKNFYILPDSGIGVGLWGNVEGVIFKNLLLEDFTVNGSGSQYVGALAGYVDRTVAEGCGIYLTQAAGRNMEEHVRNTGVIGDNYVGGMFGYINASPSTRNNFAAVRVVAEAKAWANPYKHAHAGGLVGWGTATWIYDSYASGDVITDGSRAGGLLGWGSGMRVYNSYATGNVKGISEVGGFAGWSTGGFYENCIAYGEVLGTATQPKPTYAGGFMSDFSGNTYNGECRFLSQAGYNDRGLTDNSAVIKTTYDDMPKGTLTAEDTHPYATELHLRAFPFLQVLPHHYGDWPFGGGIPTPPPERNDEIKDDLLNTESYSGVFYFERYEDGTYGIYAVGSVTQSGVPPTHRVINTLGRVDEVITRKGYGIFNHHTNSCKYDVPSENIFDVKLDEFAEMQDDEYPLPDIITDYEAHLIKELALDDDASELFTIVIKKGNEKDDATIPDISTVRPD